MNTQSIEIKLYSAIGEPTHFHATLEAADESGYIQRYHTPRDQAFFLKERLAAALRDSDVAVRERQSASGSFSLIIDAPLSAHQAQLMERYYMPGNGIKELLLAAGAI